MFSKNFIAATKEYSKYGKHIPAPYLRKSFTAKAKVRHATVTVCGLGFYELFVNGDRLTKGLLAPYISNPDDILYYDEYDLTAHLTAGKNVLGFCLGNGMLNCPRRHNLGFSGCTVPQCAKAGNGAANYLRKRRAGANFCR